MANDVDAELKAFRWSAVAAFWLGLSLSAAANEAIEPGVERVSIFVSDLERSLTFYEDALGFDPDDIVSHEPNSFAHEVFGLNADASVREVLLRARNDEAIIGLVEVRRSGLEVAANRGRAAIWVEVRMFDEVVAKVRELGLTLLTERSTENLSRQAWSRFSDIAF